MMNPIFNFKIFLFIFICTSSLPAQIQLSGQIRSATDSLPIPGAAVYFDGTSIGTATGDDGLFSIKAKNTITSSLIINALGYKTRIFTNPMENSNPGIILMEESQESLGIVHLETDPWSREKKLQIFRKEFLGNSPGALKCKIKNEDVLNLRYIPSIETLVASADEPLQIINRHLGYEVTYNLTDFKAEFSTTSGLRLTSMVYYEGYSFYEELNKKRRKRYLKNRENIYKGSSLHFMRSLSSQKISENGFRIFLKGWEVLPYSYFKIRDFEEITEVELLAEKLTLVYGPLLQSDIQAKGKFYIDRHGNFTPPQNVLFSGEMSKSRVAEMLPLNYNQ